MSFVFEVLEKQPWRLLTEAAATAKMPVVKRRRTATPSQPAVVLLDIEGTTTPISFVKDKLFPFAAEAVGPWLQRATAEELAPVIETFKAQCQQDGAVFEGDGASAASKVECLTKEWISKDRKVPALKDLQGRLWRAGYERGELKGEMFEDTPQAIARWVSNGSRVAIFSSGSREAQQLIFGYSDKGDLSGYI